MRCENCGKRLPDNAHFCTKCGGRVSGRSRAEDIVEIAGLAASIPPEDVADVPEIPELAPPPLEGPAPAEPADIPEPALLPREQRADTEVSSTLPLTSAVMARDSRLREAAQLLSQATEAKEEVRPEHLGIRGEMEQDSTPSMEAPPQLAPPPPSEDGGQHVGMGEQDLTAHMYESRRVEVEHKSEEVSRKNNCCGCGCFVLALLFIITLLVIIYLSTGGAAPESASAAALQAPGYVSAGIAGGAENCSGKGFIVLPRSAG